ncbi:hypothetical protein F2Q70_00002139 [Brassica cretica]|uniref:Uncharacterized protein n=1 Tax=Brassica cretica TaxID=69181 RepID=A0A8S9IXC1_BRACR|nr:hypothetical protein F2Q70_00002139 [Brassica cretica]
MPPKKKKKSRNLLQGSSNMARLQGFVKPSRSVKALRKSSPLATASCADAVTADSVVLTSDKLPLKSEDSVDLGSRHLSPSLPSCMESDGFNPLTSSELAFTP